MWSSGTSLHGRLGSGRDNYLTCPAGRSTEVGLDARCEAVAKVNYVCNANGAGPPITCKCMIVADAEIRIRHGSRLVLRNANWLLRDVEQDYAYLGRQVLAALRFDARALLAAASNKFKGVVEISELMKGQEEQAADASPQTSINSIVHEQPYEYGSTFHRH